MRGRYITLPHNNNNPSNLHLNNIRLLLGRLEILRTIYSRHYWVMFG